MSKPRVTTNCVANTYTGDGERIIEFSDRSLDPGDGTGPPGGLIAFRRTSDGRLLVQVYRCDGPVEVTVGAGTPVFVNGLQFEPHRAYDALGAAAFHRGERRIVPRHILVDHGTAAAEVWYRGWDRENIAAPVEGVDA